MAHRFLLKLLNQQVAAEAMAESTSQIVDMRNELREFLVKLQDDGGQDGNAGIYADKGDSSRAQATFQAGKTDLSKYFQQKSQSAIGTLPSALLSLKPDDNVPTDAQSRMPEYKEPSADGQSISNVNLTQYQNESMMNGGGSFFNDVQPFAQESAFAAI